MAKLPSLRKIQTEDLPGAPTWIAPLLTILNNFLTSVTAALNGNLALEDNVKAQILKITITAPVVGLKVPTTVQPVSAVILGRIDGVTPSSMPALQWHQAQGAIVLDTIDGLVSNEKYTITLIVL